MVVQFDINLECCYWRLVIICSEEINIYLLTGFYNLSSWTIFLLLYAVLKGGGIWGTVTFNALPGAPSRTLVVNSMISLHLCFPAVVDMGCWPAQTINLGLTERWEFLAAFLFLFWNDVAWTLCKSSRLQWLFLCSWFFLPLSYLSTLLLHGLLWCILNIDRGHWLRWCWLHIEYTGMLGRVKQRCLRIATPTPWNLGFSPFANVHLIVFTCNDMKYSFLIICEKWSLHPSARILLWCSVVEFGGGLSF